MAKSRPAPPITTGRNAQPRRKRRGRRRLQFNSPATGSAAQAHMVLDHYAGGATAPLRSKVPARIGARKGLPVSLV